MKIDIFALYKNSEKFIYQIKISEWSDKSINEQVGIGW